MGELVVIALGGNAIVRPGQRGAFEEQVASVRQACAAIARVVARGYSVVLVHGNGPQVGALLLQNELARDRIPPMPLHACVAQTQGLIGYMIQRELAQALAAHGIPRPVVALVTHVVVDRDDPAFANPSKPVGPFYGAEEAAALQAAGWPMREDAGRGWRRVVPSPVPRRVVELEAVRALLQAGAVVVCCGGGGIPVIEGAGGLEGVDAVVDKDLAAQRLAVGLGAEVLVILTDVPCVYLGYSTPRQRPLYAVSADEMDRYLAEGHFPPGSMRSKVEGALGFLRAGGRRAAIARLDQALEAVEGAAGTQILPCGSGAAVAGVE